MQDEDDGYVQMKEQRVRPDAARKTGTIQDTGGRLNECEEEKQEKQEGQVADRRVWRLKDGRTTAKTCMQFPLT